MDFKTELLNKLQGIKGAYEDGSKLGEYAKGRYEITKVIIDIVKNLSISDVVQQRELLIGFFDWWMQNSGDFDFGDSNEDVVNVYLANL